MNLINLIDQGTSIVLSSKTGKTGSFARAVAFADRQTRMDMGHTMYANWLKNGQYRPLVNDILDTLIPKSAAPYIAGLVPATGAVSKNQLLNLCMAVDSAVKAKGADKAPKGQKAFVYGLVQRIAEQGAPETIEAQ